MSSGRKLVTFNRTWSLILVITTTKQDPISWRKSKLGAIIMCQFSWILCPIKFYFLEKSFSCGTDHPQSINSIVVTNCYWWVNDPFNSCFLWTRRIHKSLSTIFHSHSIGNDNSIDSASNNNIVLFTPSKTFYLPRMPWKSHTLRIFSCEKFENMKLIAWSCSKVLSSIWKFDIRTVFKWIYIFKVTQRFSILLNIENSQFIWIGNYKMKTWRMKRKRRSCLSFTLRSLHSFILVVPDFDSFVFACSSNEGFSDTKIHRDNRSWVKMQANLF